MGQKAGEKWTAEAVSQPTIPKPDWLLDAADRAKAQATLQRLLARHELQHNIALRLPLDQIVQAHQAVEAGQTVGNIVLNVG